MTPVETLAEGCKILDSILVPSGFRFISGQAGKSSGGHFASGAYVRNERRLELHYRYSLGLVSYHFRELTASHESVIRALGVYGNHQYPGFSDAPLDAFVHLRNDLETFFQIFIAGSDEALSSLLALAQHKEATRPKGIKGLP